MDRVLGDPKTIASFLLPALVLYLLMMVAPIGLSVWYGLHEWNGMGALSFVGARNFVELLRPGSVFLLALGNSVVLTVLTLLIQIPVALVLALTLAHGVKGEATFRTWYFVPVILPSTVVGLLWKRIYDPNFGLLNALLGSLGLGSLATPWLGDQSTVLAAVCAPVIWQWIGYHMLLLYASAKSVPSELREAAAIDGAGPVRTALGIVLPQMRSVVGICVTLSVIGSMKHFDMAYLLTNGGPAHASEMPSTLMMTTIFKTYQYGKGSAMAVFIVVECLLATLLLSRLFRGEDRR